MSRAMASRMCQDLIVWQKAMDLVIACYKASESFPKAELFGLSSQLRRAAVSVPANIAEGRGRFSQRDFLRHLSVAFGSLLESETHLLIAEQMGYMKPSVCDQVLLQSAEVGRLIQGLANSLRSRINDTMDGDHGGLARTPPGP